MSNTYDPITAPILPTIAIEETATFDEVVDLIDVYCMANGATNRTRRQPSESEIRRAKGILSIECRAYLKAHSAVNGSFPAVTRGAGETNKQFLSRLYHDCTTNVDLWKNAVLAGVEFTVPHWITASLAQDQRWTVGSGDTPDAAIVPGDQRVHIEARVQRTPQPQINWYVIYPRAVVRADGRIEIGSGRICRKTIKHSRWRIKLGWINDGPRRNHAAQLAHNGRDAEGDGAAAPPPALNPQGR